MHHCKYATGPYNPQRWDWHASGQTDFKSWLPDGWCRRQRPGLERDNYTQHLYTPRRQAVYG
ncbi:hypothetical protein SOASR031_18630 [Leminorella grimontii]|nr:hypothetical protein SOASR031_18630 [Leminorella grimontii]